MESARRGAFDRTREVAVEVSGRRAPCQDDSNLACVKQREDHAVLASVRRAAQTKRREVADGITGAGHLAGVGPRFEVAGEIGSRGRSRRGPDDSPREGVEPPPEQDRQVRDRLSVDRVLNRPAKAPRRAGGSHPDRGRRSRDVALDDDIEQPRNLEPGIGKLDSRVEAGAKLEGVFSESASVVDVVTSGDSVPLRLAPKAVTVTPGRGFPPSSVTRPVTKPVDGG